MSKLIDADLLIEAIRGHLAFAMNRLEDEDKDSPIVNMYRIAHEHIIELVEVMPEAKVEE